MANPLDTSLFRKAFSLVGGAGPMAFGLLAALAGCTVNATVDSATCAPDSTLTCSIGDGYLCQPNALPSASLNCSAGTPEPGGDMAYCCTAFTTGATPTCTASSAVTCTTGAGYDCTGGASPSPALNCSAGVVQADDSTGYCCTTTTATCSVSSTITCMSGVTAYDCTGGIVPDSTTLSCGGGATQPDGSMGFCCNPATTTTTSTCAANSGVSCITTGSAGYSCTGTDTPYEAMPTLICETAGATGGTSYCCLTSANSCVQASTITDCPSGAIGVSCTGSDMPTATGASDALVCNPDPGGTAGGFCCATN